MDAHIPPSAGDSLPHTSMGRRSRNGGLIALCGIAFGLLVAAGTAVLWHKPQPMTDAEVEIPEQFEPELDGDALLPEESEHLAADKESTKDRPASEKRESTGGEAADAETEDAEGDSRSDAEELMRAVESAAERGDWKEAARALETVTSEFNVPLIIWHYRALACLKIDDQESYRDICESMLDRVILSPRNLDGINSVAWMCAIGAHGVENPNRPVILAKMLLDQLPEESTPRHAYLNTVGAVYLRAGMWDQAIESLNDGIKVSGGEGVEQDWLLLALAFHGRREPEQARRWLNKKPTGPGPDLPASLAVWNQAEVELLRAEATRTIVKK